MVYVVATLAVVSDGVAVTSINEFVEVIGMNAIKNAESVDMRNMTVARFYSTLLLFSLLYIIFFPCIVRLIL